MVRMYKPGNRCLHAMWQLPEAPVIMLTLDEYRATADTCLRSAREAQTTEERLMYLNQALVWLEAALRQDQPRPLVYRPRHVSKSDAPRMVIPQHLRSHNSQQY